MSNQRHLIIAIDGPSGAGKGTIARAIAGALNYTHVDTGAMYRTLAWYCLQKKIDVHDVKAVANACRRWKTKLVDEMNPDWEDLFPTLV